MELSCNLCLGYLSAPVCAASLVMNVAEKEWRLIHDKANALQSLRAQWGGGGGDVQPKRSKLAAVTCAEFTAEPGESTVEGQMRRSEELQVRADMLNTYDAKAAGCTASAFEASREGSSSLGRSDSSTGSSMFSSRSSSSGSSPGSSTGSGSLLGSALGSLFGSRKAPSLANEHNTTGGKLTDDKQNEKQEDGEIKASEQGNGKHSLKASNTTSVMRPSLQCVACAAALAGASALLTFMGRLRCRFHPIFIQAMHAADCSKLTSHNLPRKQTRYTECTRKHSIARACNNSYRRTEHGTISARVAASLLPYGKLSILC